MECEREKIVVEMNNTTFQDKFKRSSTLFGLRVQRSENIVIPVLVSKWDDSEGKIAFDVHSDVYSSLRNVKSVYMIRPLEILTSYRRMYSCNINGLMNRSPRLIQALLGRPPPKHIFFGDEEKDEDVKEEKENVNGRSRGGSFGEWCALAKNIKQHRKEREEEKMEREEKKIRREEDKTKKIEKKIGKQTLNTSQTNAISQFLKSDEPLCMIHGPPGTGKTKTIIGMLEMLLLSGQAKSDLRIVVCAPSNKAVYVLLRAYNAKVMSLKSSPSSVKPLLVGVEDNLPSDLRPYVAFRRLTHIKSLQP